MSLDFVLRHCIDATHKLRAEDLYCVARAHEARSCGVTTRTSRSAHAYMVADGISAGRSSLVAIGPRGERNVLILGQKEKRENDWGFKGAYPQVKLQHPTNRYRGGV